MSICDNLWIKKEKDYDEEKTYIALGNGRGDDAVAWLLRCRRHRRRGRDARAPRGYSWFWLTTDLHRLTQIMSLRLGLIIDD